MKILLLSALLRNNQNYIPYMFKMFKMIEENLQDSYNIKYLIYTNNNTDDTENLLKNNNFDNLEIINEDLDIEEDNINKLENKVERLYFLREDFLKEILKKKFDYLFMFDSDIYFNSSIILDMIHLINNTDYEAITCNTIGQNLPLYYDFFSLVDKNNENISLDKKKKVINFHLECFDKEIIDVKSAFGGFFLIKSKTLRNKNPTYKKGIPIDKRICEHIPFNKNFKIGFATNINPIRLKLDYPFKHKKAYNIIKENNSENRNIKRDLAILIIEIILCLISLGLIIIKKRYDYIFLLIISICLIINNFQEFF